MEVVSFIALAQIATELAISFGRLARRLHSAEAEMENFRVEIKMFAENLLQLHTVLEKGSNLPLILRLKKKLRRSETMRFAQKLLDDLKEVKEEIKIIKSS